MRCIHVCSKCQEFSFKLQLGWSFRAGENVKSTYLCVCNADSTPSWIDNEYTCVELPSECPLMSEQEA